MQDDPTPTPPSRWEEDRWKRVGVRVLRTYLQGALGLLLALPLVSLAPGDAIPKPQELLQAAVIIFGFPLPGALVAFLQNTIEELNKIDPGTPTRG